MDDKKTQGTGTVRRLSRRKDSLIAHCVARAMIAANGWDETVAQLEAGTAKVTTWAAAKATPKATRVAGFIILWAVAMREESRDAYTITEYQRYWLEGERQAYRLQKEFRELWPEYETPDVIARQIVRFLNSKLDKRGKLPLAVPVIA